MISPFCQRTAALILALLLACPTAAAQSDPADARRTEKAEALNTLKALQGAAKLGINSLYRKGRRIQRKRRRRRNRRRRGFPFQRGSSEIAAASGSSSTFPCTASGSVTFSGGLNVHMTPPLTTIDIDAGVEFKDCDGLSGTYLLDSFTEVVKGAASGSSHWTGGGSFNCGTVDGVQIDGSTETDVTVSQSINFKTGQHQGLLRGTFDVYCLLPAEGRLVLASCSWDGVQLNDWQGIENGCYTAQP